MFEKFLQLFSSSGFRAPSAMSPLSLEPEDAADETDRFDCPSCGAPLEIDFIGQHRSDKVANCPYCRRTIDLPDPSDANSRFRTRERVIERPNEKIVERVSEWSERTSTSSELSDEWKSRFDELRANSLSGKWLDSSFSHESESVSQTWKINGREFSSREEFQAYVRESFSADMAERLLDMVNRARN